MNIRMLSVCHPLLAVLVALAGITTPCNAHAAEQSPPDDGKLRIIAFGAHPDDCEIFAGGTACLWAQQGHHVKFVSVTNGDIGHWRMAGGPLAQRRFAEVQASAKILSTTTDVLDILRSLNERLGQTILMITHNPEAAAYAHRTVHMKDGRIV